MSRGLQQIRQRCGRQITQRALDEEEDYYYRTNEEFDISHLGDTKKCPRKKIIIVGAGFSGLYSGYLLQELGFDVTILEARDRIGGRVHTVQHGDRLVEYGGEYIGLHHREWLKLAKKFSLGMTSLTSQSDYAGQDLLMPVYLGGKILSEEEVTIAEDESNDILMRISDDANRLDYPDRPWLEPAYIRQLENISVDEKLDQWRIPAKSLGRQLVEANLSNFNCGSLSEQSYLGLMCQVKASLKDARNYWDTDENFRCSAGNVSLAYSLAKDLKINLDEPVKKIRFSNSHKQFKICTTKGSYKCDYLLMSIPPTTWDNIKFEPAFDQTKYMPSMGPGIRTINTMENRFWIKESKSPNSMNDTFGETWEATENQCVFKFNLNSNNFKESNTKNQQIFFSSFSGGPLAEKLLSYPDYYKNYTKQMEVLYGKDYTKTLKKSQLVNWPNEKYTKTGYSYGGLGHQTVASKNLYYPVPIYNDQFIFIGEYTCTNFPGFMEGALQSAKRGVKMILKMEN